MRFFYIHLLILLTIPYLLKGQDDSVKWQSRAEREKKAMQSYEMGLTAESNEDLDVAVGHYGKAIRLSPVNIDFFMARAQCRELQGDDIGALIDYETVVRIDPFNPNAYFKRAWLYYRLKRYSAAVEDFSRVIHDDNVLGTTTFLFTGVEYNEGGHTEMTGVTTVDRLKPDAYNGRALSLAKLEDYEAAYEDYNHAIKINTEEPNYYVNRGLLSKELGDMDKAQEDFNHALQLFPGHKAALYNLSLIVGKAQAEKLNEKLYALGDLAVVFSKRGYERYVAGDFKGALSDYDSALVLRPDFAQDLVNRGLVRAKLGFLVEAIDDYKRALELEPAFTRNYVHMGNAYQTLKQFDKAIAFYSLYLTLEGADPGVYYNRGIAAYKLDKKDQACPDLVYALKLGESRAQEALRSICDK